MKSLGGPHTPTWRSRVENALYDEAKWPADQVNYFMDQLRKEHAHELAEKVMALRANVPGYAASAAWKRGYEAALTMAVLEIENPQKEGQ